MNIHWLTVRDYFIKFHYILLIFKIDANNNKINFIQQYTALASCFIMEKQKIQKNPSKPHYYNDLLFLYTGVGGVACFLC